MRSGSRARPRPARRRPRPAWWSCPCPDRRAPAAARRMVNHRALLLRPRQGGPRAPAGYAPVGTQPWPAYRRRYASAGPGGGASSGGVRYAVGRDGGAHVDRRWGGSVLNGRTTLRQRAHEPQRDTRVLRTGGSVRTAGRAWRKRDNCEQPQSPSSVRAVPSGPAHVEPRHMPLGAARPPHAAACPPRGTAPGRAARGRAAATPSARTTRHHGTAPPYSAMTRPTWRGPPSSSHSATSP